MSNCVTDADLDCYRAKELDQADEARVRMHLDECDPCARRDAALVARHEKLIEQVRGLDATRTCDRRAIALEPEADDVSHPVSVSTRIVIQIEGYEILRQLGEGGQGVVYQAIQQSTKRKVAIKVLLGGPYASKSTKRRFEREIELVAQLRHPNLISIFLSGVTADGRQYYVMDYIRGRRLDRYVRDKKLTLEETLGLFSQVCDASQYAHQRGVIHRDLKPSNILVDAEGNPKILDFGLAKRAAAPVDSIASITQDVIGTLPYMSPEQARANPDEIDTRTDVYALGVILYELLTGHYPYPVAGQIAEVLKHITETPPTPLTRQWTRDSGVAKRSTRRLRPGQCPIDDEVQTMVLKALAKERERRYQSAGELARDIGHYLAGEPIDAKRDSGWYVIKKSLRKYRIHSTVAAAFILLIVGFSISMSVLYARADGEARKLEAMHEFLIDEMLTGADPRNALGGVITVEDVLANAARRIEFAFPDQPEVEASIRGTIGRTYVSLGQVQEAEVHLARAEAIRARRLGDEHPDTLRSRVDLADVLLHLGRYEEAQKLLTHTLSIQERILGRAHPDTLVASQILAMVLAAQGHSDQAVARSEQTLAAARSALGANHELTMQFATNLASLLRRQGDLERAERLHRETLATERATLGEAHPDTLRTRNNLASLLRATGRLAEAEEEWREVLTHRRRVLSIDHPSVLNTMNSLAYVLQDQGKLEEAEFYFRETVAGRRIRPGDRHPKTIASIVSLAVFLDRRGDGREAEELYREALDLRRKILPERDPLIASAMIRLGGFLMDYRRPVDAEPYLHEAFEIRLQHYAADDWRLANVKSVWGACLAELGRYDQAEPLLRESYPVLQERWGDKNELTRDARARIVGLYEAWDKPDQADAFRAIRPE